MTTISIRQVSKTHERNFPDSSTYNHYRNPDWVVSSNAHPSHTLVSSGWELEGQLNLERELHRRAWAIPTIQAMANLPWSTGDWTSGGKPTQQVAVDNMLKILVAVLDDCTPPPSVVPTWSGGVQVEWHRNNLDFEIEADPQGRVEYFFKNPDEECEGQAWDDISQLVKYVQAVTVSE